MATSILLWRTRTRHARHRLAGADRRVGSTVLKFNGGPVGLDTLAASISEESDTIMDVVEPYLLQLASRSHAVGRAATASSLQPPQHPLP